VYRWHFGLVGGPSLMNLDTLSSFNGIITSDVRIKTYSLINRAARVHIVFQSIKRGIEKNRSKLRLENFQDNQKGISVYTFESLFYPLLLIRIHIAWLQIGSRPLMSHHFNKHYFHCVLTVDELLITANSTTFFLHLVPHLTLTRE